MNLPSRLSQKYIGLILQQSWYDIERQSYIMVQIPYMNLNLVHVAGELSTANKNHNIRNIIWKSQGWINITFIGIWKKFSRLDLDGDYMGISYPHYVSIYGGFFSKGASYCKHGNTTLPKNMTTQWQDDPTIQPFYIGWLIIVEVRKYQMIRIGRSTR